MNMTPPKSILTESSCPFCIKQIKPKVIIKQNDSMIAIFDSFPVSKDHMLILPKRHIADFFDMTEKEILDAVSLVKHLKQQILKDDPEVTGFNVGVNSGESAGQTIFHCHIHLIPRRPGDTPNPRGGVRGVIPEKMNYDADEDIPSQSLKKNQTSNYSDSQNYVPKAKNLY